ncbi:glycosyltransferase [Streptomyces sp. AA0539]|uniref:glycosyltransferase n=1 Tax=Streptomyces sp. AA0539 TaxID=1210045 RepID=UPI0003622159|nr:galactosyltransferase-related protein [Streptomyces sp. AA0539]
MSWLMPKDPEVLATAVADSLVIAADPYAQQASITFWHRASSWHDAVVAAVDRFPDDVVRQTGTALSVNPTDPARYRTLRSALLAADRGATAHVFSLGWRAECHSRLGFRLGSRYLPDTEQVTVADARSWGPASLSPDPATADVLIVVPFRDRGPGGMRLRNLMACLQALSDQSVSRHRYQVTVVESDDRPRWRQVIEPLVDSYLFAEKPGQFNKSWAVNAGVVHSPGQSDVICILDADALVDRDFVARNVARLRRPGTGGHLPYRDMQCLDPAATSAAIRQRVVRGVADVDAEVLRAFSVRRPVGCCLWVRASAFHAVGGMDERFEGWGGEDNDFAYRFDIFNALDSYHDPLLHMYHPASSRIEGELVNAGVPALSWEPEQPIGRLNRFVAGAI